MYYTNQLGDAVSEGVFDISTKERIDASQGDVLSAVEFSEHIDYVRSILDLLNEWNP